ncbi:MAG TPA: hypothetical protein VM529_15960 [Gemmata sp.]|jgi:recombinational DNA repair protein (RecF pathway)|nr:hypothetical protein [Gemmata sp.]
MGVIQCVACKTMRGPGEVYIVAPGKYHSFPDGAIICFHCVAAVRGDRESPVLPEAAADLCGKLYHFVSFACAMARGELAPAEADSKRLTEQMSRDIASKFPGDKTPSMEQLAKWYARSLRHLADYLEAA